MYKKLSQPDHKKLSFLFAGTYYITDHCSNQMCRNAVIFNASMTIQFYEGNRVLDRSQDELINIPHQFDDYD